MPEPCLLGVDLGTSGVKALALRLDGRVLAEAVREYPVEVAGPGWAETDPTLWWQATAAAVREVLASGTYDVVGIGVDGQMHGVVLCDGAGVPVRPALLWPDTRAQAEVEQWRRLAEPQRAALANPLVAGMAGPLLLWVERHEPQAYARARVALSPKDWLRYRLTGEFATDPSDASATLLWDVPGDRWATETVDAVGLDRALLPEVRPSGALAGQLTAAAAGELRLAEHGQPVAVGAGDTAAAVFATGLRDPGDAQLSVGSGAQLVRPLHRPTGTADPRTHVYRAATHDASSRWYAMAAVQNAGIALDWVRGLLGLAWDDLYAAAAAGPGEVTFVPYLTGERSPVLEPRSLGAWLGMGLATDRATLAGAAVEGVAFAIRHAYEALPSAQQPAEVRLTGGGGSSPVFRALLADVLGLPLRPTALRSASAVGAAMLGAAAAGLAQPAVSLVTGDLVEPGRPGRYEQAYQRYRDSVARLRRAQG
ncbi:MAG: hypothetical protein GEV07_06445 [Streptosporangiales bacterium]|nr:hypothetical protein [Streptosporangiales bacterium]